MQDPRNFYKNQLKQLQSVLVKERRMLLNISVLRLLVFVGIGVSIYLLYDKTLWVWGIAAFGIGTFLYLLRWHTDKKTKHELNLELKKVNEEEIKILQGDFQKRYDGLEFEEATHFFSSDIDLFGRGSFFQYLNRTGLKEGAAHLAHTLLSNGILDIPIKQEAIQELATIPKWMQKYMALARLTKTEIASKTISDWLKAYSPFLSKKMKYVPAVFSLVSTLLMLFSSLGFLNYWFLGIWFLIGLSTTGCYLKKSNDLNAKTSKVKDTIHQYSFLLNEIEEQDFSSKLLQEEKAKIAFDKEKASGVFQRFSKALDMYDNRNNVLVALLGNGFFLWDVYCAFQVEDWILKYSDLVSQWFGTIAFFDAYVSLGTFGFNHPEFTYPTIEENSDKLIEAESLAHPLIPQTNRIPSDLVIQKTDFFVVTGANMAGKSTFLRTVSLFVLMSNVGLPVCAESSKYAPIKLITSMRTTDSLADQSSYFFSELTRLQYIRKQLEQDSYLVILDEILKGTNSEDKAEGSKKLIESLVEKKVPGIIATHDLSLCEIAKDLEQVKNYFFETEIENDELHFDYQLKAGICKNMNASFLLKKMGIVDS